MIESIATHLGFVESSDECAFETIYAQVIICDPRNGEDMNLRDIEYQKGDAVISYL